MAEEQVFVSHRVTDFPPVPGSTKVRCHDCGWEVWVSPASRAAFNRADTVLCNRCMPPLEIPMDEIEEPSSEVYAEVEAFWGPRGSVTCRLCGARVINEIFPLREHLLGHRPESGSLPARRILEEFR